MPFTHRHNAARFLAALCLLCATGSAVAQSIVFPRLLLGPGGPTNRVFTAGDVITPLVQLDTNAWYKLIVRDGAGNLLNPTFPCMSGTAFATANSYVVQPSDPPSTNGAYSFVIDKFANGACGGSPSASATQQFYVARATAFTSPALTATTNHFTSNQTAYVRVEGLPPSLADWNVTWLLPSGSASCANTSGADQPNSSSSGRLPNSYLAYPPNASFADNWNKPANYDGGGGCDSFSIANQGQWRLRLQFNATNFVTLRAFEMSDNCIPPTVDLTNRTVCSESATTFAAEANGPGPFTFVWRKDGALIPVAGPSFTISPVTVSTAGVYTVEVIGPCGKATNSAVLSVNTLMTMLPLPNETVSPGDNVTFVAPTNGTGPFTFQWRRNGTPIFGATNYLFTTNNVSTNSSGTYSVVIAGPCNSVTDSGVLTVNSILTLTPLTNLVRYIGTIASFSTAPQGASGPVSFVWRKNGELLPDQTNSILTLSNLTTADSGTYSVEATAGMSATNSATLAVAYCFEALDVMLVIDRSGSMVGQPYTDARSAATNLIHNLLFSTNSDIVGLASYNPTGTLDHVMTTNVTLLEQAVSSLPPATNGTCISCGIIEAQNELSSIRRRSGAMPVMLFLTDGVPHDFDTPSNALYNAALARAAGTRIITVGLNDGSGTNVDKALLTSMASSTNDFFYAQRSSDLPEIFDEISAVLCRGPNDIMGPTPTNTTVCVGEDVEFNVSASGCALFTFQWFKEEITLHGQTNGRLYLPNVSVGDAGVYRVVISSFCGTITNSATLTVNSSAQIVFGALSQTTCAGGNVTFTIGAAGAGLTYQWWHGAVPLPGQTNTTLILTNVPASAHGFYYAIVSSPCGIPVATSAHLTVNTPPVLTPIGNVAACPNQIVTLQTTPSGTGPFSYVWRKNGSVISGANTNRLTLAPASALPVGTYSVEVTGICGIATNSASVILLTNTTATALPSVTRCVGEAAAFSTVASGSGSFTFVWRKDGVLLPGETDPTLIFNSVSSADAGNYSVEVRGACAAVTNSASLSVNELTTALPLESATICAGETISFNTAAQGAGPFSFAWRKDGVAIEGATNASLTVFNAAVGDSATYAVEVTGLCNSVTNSATLLVRALTTAVALLDLTHCAGDSATFATIPSGSGPFSFVWRKDGLLLPNETNATLLLNTVATNDAGVYAVEVTGACNSVTNNATLVVDELTTATALVDATVCAGSLATFAPVVQGTGPFAFVWRKDGVVIEGATNDSLIISNAAVTDGATYIVEVTGQCSSVTNSAVLTVRALTAATPMTDATRCVGESIKFTTVPSGAGPFAFVWRKDGVVLADETNSFLRVRSVTTNSAGVYSVEVVGVCNSITNSATLVVNEPVSLSPLADLARCLGDVAVFTATPSGSGPFTFAWRKNGALLANETNATLSLPVNSTNNAGVFTVEVSGACSSMTNSASLIVNTMTTATAIQDQAGCVGQNAVFTVTAGGTGPFTYTWRKDGVEIAGETNSAINLTNISLSDAAEYSVEVLGACSSATNSATLTVNTPATISGLTDLSVCGVQDVSFAPVVSGSGVFTCIWRKDGVLLAGETNATLLISAATATNAGVYSLEVYGTCGSTTNSAVLSVSTNAITVALSNQTHCAGETAALVAEVSGEGPFAFVWRKGAEVVSNAPASVLTLMNVSPADSGLYTVEVIGGCATATAEAMLTVNETLTVTPLQNLNVCAGQTAVFSTVASGGTGPYHFLWRKNGAALANQTNSSLILTNVTSTNAGLYSVEVSGCGRITNFASLSIVTPVTATLPTNLVACVCDDILLTPTVTGTGPFSCVWRKNGEVLVGETNFSLSLPMLNVLSSGQYTLELFGPCNSVTSTTMLQVINSSQGRFSNTNVLVIPQLGPASLYPSRILVQCAPKIISQLTITLHGLSHAFPDDVDIMLVAPNGTAIKLLSDCGGSGANAINNVDVMFSAEATAFLSDNAKIRAGTYKPSDYPNDIDPFQSPAPANATTTNLASLYGTNPNGNWSLFIVDDHGQDAGSLQGWTLDFGNVEAIPPNVKLTSPEMLPGGAFQMVLHGTENKIYYVEASSNLTNWTIIQTNFLIGTSKTVIDYSAPQFNFRFYRAVGCRD